MVLKDNIFFFKKDVAYKLGNDTFDDHTSFFFSAWLSSEQ